MRPHDQGRRRGPRPGVLQQPAGRLPGRRHDLRAAPRRRAGLRHRSAGGRQGDAAPGQAAASDGAADERGRLPGGALPEPPLADAVRVQPQPLHAAVSRAGAGQHLFPEQERSRRPGGAVDVHRLRRAAGHAPRRRARDGHGAGQGRDPAGHAGRGLGGGRVVGRRQRRRAGGSASAGQRPRLAGAQHRLHVHRQGGGSVSALQHRRGCRRPALLRWTVDAGPLRGGDRAAEDRRVVPESGDEGRPRPRHHGEDRRRPSHHRLRQGLPAHAPAQGTAHPEDAGCGQQHRLLGPHGDHHRTEARALRLRGLPGLQGQPLVSRSLAAVPRVRHPLPRRLRHHPGVLAVQHAGAHADRRPDVHAARRPRLLRDQLRHRRHRRRSLGQPHQGRSDARLRDLPLRGVLPQLLGRRRSGDDRGHPGQRDQPGDGAGPAGPQGDQGALSGRPEQRLPQLHGRPRQVPDPARGHQHHPRAPSARPPVAAHAERRHEQLPRQPDDQPGRLVHPRSHLLGQRQQEQDRRRRHLPLPLLPALRAGDVVALARARRVRGRHRARLPEAAAARMEPRPPGRRDLQRDADPRARAAADAADGADPGQGPPHVGRRAGRDGPRRLPQPGRHGRSQHRQRARLPVLRAGGRRPARAAPAARFRARRHRCREPVPERRAAAVPRLEGDEPDLYGPDHRLPLREAQPLGLLEIQRLAEGRAARRAGDRRREDRDGVPRQAAARHVLPRRLAGDGRLRVRAERAAADQRRALCRSRGAARRYAGVSREQAAVPHALQGGGHRARRRPQQEGPALPAGPHDLALGRCEGHARRASGPRNRSSSVPTARRSSSTGWRTSYRTTTSSTTSRSARPPTSSASTSTS